MTKSHASTTNVSKHEGSGQASLSRRQFATGAGALGLGALGVGIAMTSNSAQADEAHGGKGIPQEWDEEADVVIVGFGAAGAGAAMSALEAGADVLILEKMGEAQAGGDTTCFSGVLWAVTDPALIEQYSSHAISPQNAQATADAAAEALDRFTTCPGVEMDGANIVGGAPAFYAALSAECVSRGARVMYETPATGIICDPTTGEARGVWARRGELQNCRQGAQGSRHLLGQLCRQL